MDVSKKKYTFTQASKLDDHMINNIPLNFRITLKQSMLPSDVENIRKILV